MNHACCLAQVSRSQQDNMLLVALPCCLSCRTAPGLLWSSGGTRSIRWLTGSLFEHACFVMQNMQREPAVNVRHDDVSEKQFTSRSEGKQPMKPPALTLHTDARTDALPTAAVAIPVAPNSSPRVQHVQSSASTPTSIAQSLQSARGYADRRPSPPVPSAILSANAPEFRSIQEFCFDAASLGISESASRVSVVENDVECHSSTSEHSSGTPLEVKPPTPLPPLLL